MTRHRPTRREILSLGAAAMIAGLGGEHLFATNTPDADAFVRVSPRNPGYFELSDGKPYIPIGINMVGTPAWGDDNLEKLENDWFRKLAENKGNYIRIWLSHDHWEIERKHPGERDEARVRKLDRLFMLARKYGLRMKLCTEHFRHLGEKEQKWTGRPILHENNGGMASSTPDYFTGEAGRKHYKEKLKWYADRYGSDPIVFGWELWNEMDCINAPPEVWRRWSAEMLAELHRLFPKNMAMQSLGSYDFEGKRKDYEDLCRLPGNDVLQVHRYLDLGARWKICHAPVAELGAQAVRELLAFDIPKPVLLAESGAVEPNHAGPFKLYDKDKDGILLHDVLFAPFFAGAAGCGQCWHWDRYVHKNDLWYHFSRFASAIDGLDPIAENPVPFEVEHDRLYVYGLAGRKNTWIWCRDRQNTWKTELAEETPPETLRGVELDLSGRNLHFDKIRVYDPWTDRRSEIVSDGAKIRLPDFKRSLVLTLPRDGRSG